MNEVEEPEEFELYDVKYEDDDEAQVRQQEQ